MWQCVHCTTQPPASRPGTHLSPLSPGNEWLERLREAERTLNRCVISENLPRSLRSSLNSKVQQVYQVQHVQDANLVSKRGGWPILVTVSTETRGQSPVPAPRRHGQSWGMQCAGEPKQKLRRKRRAFQLSDRPSGNPASQPAASYHWPTYQPRS